MSFDRKVQLLVIGDAAVGKTSILSRFAQDKFSPQYLATLGIDFFTKDVMIDKEIIHIKIWDTAGEERYRSLTKGFFKNGEGIIIVYDVANKNSFESLKFWIDSIENNNNLENKEMPAVILGNKIDISDRQVNENEAEEFTKSRNYKYFEVSAKSGKCVDESIKYLIKKVIEVADGDKKLHKSIKITNDDKDKNRHKTDRIKDSCNKK